MNIDPSAIKDNCSHPSALPFFSFFTGTVLVTMVLVNGATSIATILRKDMQFTYKRYLYFASIFLRVSYNFLVITKCGIAIGGCN